MKSESEDFLGIDKIANKHSPKSKWWFAAIGAPFLAPILVYLFLAANNPHPEGFAGFGLALAFIFISPAVAGLISILFTTIAFIKGEPLAPLGLILALPLFGYLCWGAVTIAINAPESQGTRAEHIKLYSTLKNDPEIALRERWYLPTWYSSNPLRRRIFKESMSDASVPYTLPQLKRLYSEAPITRDLIFRHPACDEAFLREHFQEAFDKAKKEGEKSSNWNFDMISAFINNPNIPDDLLEKAEGIPGIIQMGSQSILNNRRNARIESIIQACMEAMSSKPDLLSDPEYWNQQQSDTNQIAYKSLIRLIRDKNYQFPSAAEEVVKKQFPNDQGIVEYIISKQFRDQPEIVADEAFWMEQKGDTNQIALKILYGKLRDQSYSLPPHGEEILLKEFPTDPQVVTGVKYVTRPWLPKQGEVTNVNASLNVDGSMDVHWSNPTTDPRDTNPIILRDSQGQTIGTAPAGSTYLHIPRQ